MTTPPPPDSSSPLEDIQQALEREESRLQKLCLVREADLRKHQQSVKGKLWGDLLKQNLSKIARTAESVELAGYDETGAEVREVIPLNPSLSPKENMEACFRAYKKGIKGLSKSGMLLEETKRQLEETRKLKAAAATLPEEHLPLFAEHAVIVRLLAGRRVSRQSAPQATGAMRGPFDDLEPALRPRVFTSVDGWTILAGKGARANDYLTMRIANGNDWFFHIAGHPGAHIILRNKADQTPPLETLLDCGLLCLHYSKQKNATNASVHYVQKKFVSKPKGAKPGLVFVHGGKTISVQRDAARLKRLLGKLLEGG